MAGTTKGQKAVALRYQADKDAAPVIIASGYGDVAERIINVAEKQGIPVYRDDSAASLLCMLDVGASIPPKLYKVVAEIYCQILTIASQDDAPSGSGGPASLLDRLRGSRS